MPELHPTRAILSNVRSEERRLVKMSLAFASALVGVWLGLPLLNCLWVSGTLSECLFFFGIHSLRLKLHECPSARYTLHWLSKYTYCTVSSLVKPCWHIFFFCVMFHFRSEERRLLKLSRSSYSALVFKYTCCTVSSLVKPCGHISFFCMMFHFRSKERRLLKLSRSSYSARVFQIHMLHCQLNWQRV